MHVLQQVCRRKERCVRGYVEAEGRGGGERSPGASVRTTSHGQCTVVSGVITDRGLGWKIVPHTHTHTHTYKHTHMLTGSR